MAIKVNPQGYYVDDSNNFTDKDGNPSPVPVKAEAQTPLQTEVKTAKEKLEVSREELQKLIDENVKAALTNFVKGQPTTQAFDYQALASVMRETLLEAQGRNRRALGALPIRREEIDVADILEEPKIFYAHCQHTAIFDDYVNGHVVYPPYNKPIRFRHLFRSRKQTAGGKNDGNTIAMCSAKVYSKKQYDWLKKHSNYNILFFENVQQAQNVDSLMADKLREIDARLGTNEYDIIKNAQQLGIPVTPDLKVLRGQVIYALARQVVEQEKKRFILPETDFSKEATKSQKLDAVEY